MFDVAIIGGGVIGCAAAWALSRYEGRFCLLEAHEDVANETSKANSAIVHAGFDAEAGTEMARLNVLGNAMFDMLHEDLEVPFIRNGSLVLAFDDEDMAHVKELYERGIKNGVPGLEIWDKARVLEKEPNISENIVGALWAPTGGITCPYELTIALGETAAMNGTEFIFNFRADKIEKDADGFTISAGDRKVRAKYIINAAGLYADEVSALAGGETFGIYPRKGEYIILDRSEGNTVSSTIFQTPSKMGKGILVTPTVDGNLLLGPTAEDGEIKDDFATTAKGLAEVRTQSTRSVPGIRFNKAIKTFAGNRAQTPVHDFHIKVSDKVPGLVHAAGICSPGLTSAPAIGEELVGLLSGIGFELKPRADYKGKRKAIRRFREMNPEERAEAIARDPRYGRIICRCETVSEAEIVEAMHRPIPARSLDAVKRRTRAGMGRCQSGFCSPYVMKLLCREHGMKMEEVTKFGGQSFIVYGKTAEPRQEDAK